MSNIKTTWLKNNKNGLLFLLAESDRFLYSETLFVEATEQEIEGWQEGTYWKQYEDSKIVEAPVITEPKKVTRSVRTKIDDANLTADQADKVPETGESNPPTQDLESKTNPELLAMLQEIDPQTTADERTKKADLVEQIRVFTEAKAN